MQANTRHVFLKKAKISHTVTVVAGTRHTMICDIRAELVKKKAAHGTIIYTA